MTNHDRIPAPDEDPEVDVTPAPVPPGERATLPTGPSTGEPSLIDEVVSKIVRCAPYWSPESRSGRLHEYMRAYGPELEKALRALPDERRRRTFIDHIPRADAPSREVLEQQARDNWRDPGVKDPRPVAVAMHVDRRTYALHLNQIAGNTVCPTCGANPGSACREVP